MDVSPVNSSSLAISTQQLMGANELQIAILKNLAEVQEQMAEVLQALGIGQNIDITI